MDMPADSGSPGRTGHASLRKGRASEPGRVYLVTAATHGRERLFDNWRAAAPAAAAFERPSVLGDARMLAWVLMPDHAHWLIELGTRDRLATVVGRIKAASGRDANSSAGRRGRVWQPAFHDRAMRKEDDLAAIARYIIANPKRANLVRRVGDYPYWNAIWL